MSVLPRNLKGLKMLNRSSNAKYEITLPCSNLGCLIFAAFILVALCLGPFFLAYDINKLNDIFDGHLREVSMWEPAVFICGVVLSELAAPIALILWLLSSIGLC